jgi:16S rRNA (cytidine1402-2'-O)-methyltransferase
MTDPNAPDTPEFGRDTDQMPNMPHRAGARMIPPGLHLIATPIGAARDITLRALDLLAGGDVLAAEDTRSLRRLMEMHGISVGKRPLLAYHDHNGAQMRPKLMAALAEGKSVVYASEAGTPLVADPGYQLGRAAIDAGHKVLAAPGASAVLAALTVAGLPSDRFCFMGFAPPQAGARKKFLAEAAIIPATIVFYESPKRVSRFLGELRDSMGGARNAAVCRELTKRFEEVCRGTLTELAEEFATRDVKGEIVVLVDRAGEVVVTELDMEEELTVLLQTHSVKEASAIVAEKLSLPKRTVYQAALKLEDAP